MCKSSAVQGQSSILFTLLPSALPASFSYFSGDDHSTSGTTVLSQRSNELHSYTQRRAPTHPHNHQRAGTLLLLEPRPEPQLSPQPYLLIHKISLPQLLPPLKPVVPKFECLGVFADDAFFGFGESFGFGGVDVHGDFEVSTAAG